MGVEVRSIEYYYCTVPDVPGEAAALLGLLAEHGVDLLAFSIMPTGPTHTQLMLFPSVSGSLIAAAKRAQLELTGPQYALYATGDDELGSLVDLHQKLADADINVYAANGVLHAKGGFGYVLYVRPEDFKRAAEVVGVRGAPSWAPPPKHHHGTD